MSIHNIMALKIDLALLPQFDPLNKPSSISQRWKSWTRCFQTYIAAMNIKDNKQKGCYFFNMLEKLCKKSLKHCLTLAKIYAKAQEKLDE